MRFFPISPAGDNFCVFWVTDNDDIVTIFLKSFDFSIDPFQKNGTSGIVELNTLFNERFFKFFGIAVRCNNNLLNPFLFYFFQITVALQNGNALSCQITHNFWVVDEWTQNWLALVFRDIDGSLHTKAGPGGVG